MCHKAVILAVKFIKYMSSVQAAGRRASPTDVAIRLSALCIAFRDFVLEVDRVVDAIVEEVAVLVEAVEPIWRSVESQKTAIHWQWVRTVDDAWSQFWVLANVALCVPIELAKLHDQVNEVLVIFQVTFVRTRPSRQPRVFVIELRDRDVLRPPGLNQRVRTD